MLKVDIKYIFMLLFVVLLSYPPIYHIYHSYIVKDVTITRIEKIESSFTKELKNSKQIDYYFVYLDELDVKHTYRTDESGYKLYQIGDNISIESDNPKILHFLFTIAYIEYVIVIFLIFSIG